MSLAVRGGQMTFEELMALGPEELVAEIGRATIANLKLSRSEPFVADHLQLTPEYDPVEFGKRVLRRIERELYNLVCSNSASEEKERASIRAAAGLGNATLAGTLVTVLTTNFGVDHSVAIATSAFVVKYVFNPAGAELCQFGKERM